MGEKGDETPDVLEARKLSSRRGIVGVVAAAVVFGASFFVTRNIVNDDSKTTVVAAKGNPAASSPAAAAGTQPAPDPASLPARAILLTGESGDNIGPIAQDGQSRFLSLTGPGVAKGDAAGRSIAIVWDKGTGKITSFGANLHTGTNHGHYGINPFRNVSSTGAATGTTAELYKGGCAIDVGETACRSDRTDVSPIVNGDQLTIIVGEAGNLDALGDFSMDWWFVFQPD